ncbi:MAG: hypothetical protein HDT39_00230 [Lachnospiraceae bacterium]|nr:hypothetical protein [Lachnospiraceae bacterium]
MDFDTNKFVELSDNDNFEVNGGNPVSVIIAIGGVYCACDLGYQLYRGFKAGWKAGGRK